MYTNDLHQARLRIEGTDKKIASIVALFNAASLETPAVPTTEKNKMLSPARDTLALNKVPVSLLDKIVALFDLSGRDQDETRIKLCELAGLLVERFAAVIPVVQEKAKLGVKESLDPAQHQNVLDRGAGWVAGAGGSADLGRAVFKTIADEFVAAQNQYLGDGTGPVADFLQYSPKASTSESRRPGW